jgi:hypothetical protein
MGYSISVNIRSVRLRDKMLAFLEENWRRWPELDGGKREDPAFASDPETGKDVSYNNGQKCNIGISYNACEPERDYIFQFIRWLAIIIGKKKRFKGIKDPVPYMLYDGDECWPVLIKGKQKLDKGCEWAWAIYDRYGTKQIKDYETKIYGIFDLDVEKEFDKMRNEMKRLEKLWNKHCKENG